jgi:hypothetical protein
VHNTITEAIHDLSLPKLICAPTDPLSKHHLHINKAHKHSHACLLRRKPPCPASSPSPARIPAAVSFSYRRCRSNHQSPDDAVLPPRRSSAPITHRPHRWPLHQTPLRLPSPEPWCPQAAHAAFDLSTRPPPSSLSVLSPSRTAVLLMPSSPSSPCCSCRRDHLRFPP